MFDALIAIGALLFGGVLAARIAERLRLPRLTGHMLFGLLLGAVLLRVLDPDTRAALRQIERAVACVIAYCVGSLLSWRDVRASQRTVSWVVPCSILAVIACSAVTLLLAMPHAADPGIFVAALSITLAAVSPTVVVAVSNELHADGPLTRTVLTSVVVADVLLMTSLIALSAGTTFATGGSGAAEEVVRALSVALAAGIALGIVLSRLERAPVAVVLAAVVLAGHLLGKLLGPSAIAPLAASVAAGIVGGASAGGAETTERALPRVVLPVAAALLFGLEGMLLDLSVLAPLLAPAFALVAVRSLGIWLGARVGSGAAQAEPKVRRWAFAGFLPQAGFALAMVSLLPELFPQLGEAARALAVGVIGINELLMPAVLRHALTSAGEARGVLGPARAVAE